MGKTKNKPRPPSFATSGTWHTHYIVLFDDMLESLPFTHLSAQSVVAYMILKQEYKGEYTGNRVICPYSTFVKKGMTRSTISRALAQLECYGFISVEPGGLEHQPSVYEFAEGWKDINSKEKLAEADSRFQDLMNRKRLAREQRKSYNTG